MNTLEFTQSLQYSLFIASIFIAALFIICTVSLALRNYEIRHELKKLKKWRKFSEIEKKQKHEEYDKLASELTEERAFNDTQGSMHVKLMLKYAAIQETSGKMKDENTSLRTELKAHEIFITELKKEIEQYQYAVKDLRVEIDQLKAKPERPRNAKGKFVRKHERDWTTATKEELLAEAKRRYPVGTKIVCLHDQPFDMIDSDNFELSKYGDCIRHRNTDWYLNCVYQSGNWAKIIPNA